MCWWRPNDIISGIATIISGEKCHDILIESRLWKLVEKAKHDEIVSTKFI